MKPFNIKLNRKFIALAMVLVAALLVVFGKEHAPHGIAVANVAAISLTDAEKTGFSDTEQKFLLAAKKLAATMAEEATKGKLSEAEAKAIMKGLLNEVDSETGKSIVAQMEELKTAMEAQGTSMQELGAKIEGNAAGNKSIAQVLKENEEDIRNQFKAGSGSKTFHISMNHKGEFVMRPIDLTKLDKTAGIHATTDPGGGVTAAIAQSLNAATLLRIGADAPIISQYRNTPWVFDLCNQINAGMDQSLAMWLEESALEGGSNTVAEGTTKPISKYAYELKSTNYRKEATLVSFTDEFNFDFARLQSDILGKARIDLVNNINTKVLADVVSNAVAYNSAAAFQGGTALTGVNDHDVIAAMAAQVDNNTFGAVTNAAVMSTYKKWKLGILKDDNKAYLKRPEVLGTVPYIGNPSMANDNVLVGDFKQYNILLRGGMIVRVGYNGTDFAENKFSVVLEQYYFNYISNIRKQAIVKGPDFQTVKQALEAA